MRILELLDNLDVIELDVEVLVHTLENALELDVVFQLHGDLVVDERLEETKGGVLERRVGITCGREGRGRLGRGVGDGCTHLKKSMAGEG